MKMIPTPLVNRVDIVYVCKYYKFEINDMYIYNVVLKNTYGYGVNSPYGSFLKEPETLLQRLLKTLYD